MMPVFAAVVGVCPCAPTAFGKSKVNTYSKKKGACRSRRQTLNYEEFYYANLRAPSPITTSIMMGFLPNFFWNSSTTTLVKLL